MPSPFGVLYAGFRPGPDAANQRPCGCHSDPVVFGHRHPAGCESKFGKGI